MAIKGRTQFSAGVYIIFAIAVFIAIFSAPAVRTIIAHRQRLPVLRVEYSKLEQENIALRQKMCDLQNNGFVIECHARELGLVKPGEKVYRVSVETN
ncbi:MAG: septum formation initiator family protein [Elusimicrobiota bacterium]